MNVSDYLGRVYEAPPCWQLAADVYLSELGQAVEAYKTISESIRQLASSLRQQAIADAFRIALHKNHDGFEQIAAPVDFALVLMGVTERRGLHHCGVYYAGKVLHAKESGNLYQDMSSLGDEYRLIQYWSR